MPNAATKDNTTEEVKGLGPYIVKTPFPKALYMKPEDSPTYKKILDDAKEMKVYGSKTSEYYRKRAGLPEGKLPSPEMFHTEEMLNEAIEEAKKKGFEADDDGRFWFWTEEEAAACLIHYMNIENYGPGGTRNHLRDAWPYRKGSLSQVYLDRASKPFKKSKMEYIGNLMTPAEKQVELEKAAARRALANS